jgi:hypothetical protein
VWLFGSFKFLPQIQISFIGESNPEFVSANAVPESENSETAAFIEVYGFFREMF